MNIRVLICAVFLSITLLSATPTSDGRAEDSSPIFVATTTTTENSGLLDYLTPMMESALGFRPRFVIVGSGKALRLGMAQDVSMLWVHDEDGEKKFIAQGFGLRREKIMYNQFVLIGPKDDPAGVRRASDIVTALRNIVRSEQLFVSRGDDSGTHRKELSLFRQLFDDTEMKNLSQNSWYRELGVGMGATINVAAELQAYTLSDQATWLKYGGKERLALLYSGGEMLRNPYSAIVVNQPDERHRAAAERLTDWLISAPAQQAIADYRLHGQQAFFPLRLPH